MGGLGEGVLLRWNIFGGDVALFARGGWGYKVEGRRYSAAGGSSGEVLDELIFA